MRLDQFPYITVTVYYSYFGSVLGSESLANHDQIPKKSSTFVRMKVFPVYDGIGVSDALIYVHSMLQSEVIPLYSFVRMVIIKCLNFYATPQISTPVNLIGF